MSNAQKQLNISQFPKGQVMSQPQEKESFTQTPNAFFDKLLEEIDTLSELKITLALIRKISGWIEFKDGVPVRKEGDEVSFSQFVEMTGLSRPMVKQGIDAALARGSITRSARGLGFYYQLNLTNYDNAGYESKRDAQLAKAREQRSDDRFSSKTGLVTKPLEGVVAKPETGLVAKHTKEIELNKDLNKLTTPNGVEAAATNVDVNQCSQELISNPSSRQVEAFTPGPDMTSRQDREVAGNLIDNPPAEPIPKKPQQRKPRLAKEPDPTLKDPRLLMWRKYADLAEYWPWPNLLQRQKIINNVPIERLVRWEKALDSWVGHGWQMRNVEDQLEFFVTGKQPRK